jgi:predicted outer membrane protein
MLADWKEPFEPMRAHLARAVAPAILVLTVAGCAHEQRPSPPAPRVEVRVPARPAPPPLSAARYVATSGSIDLFVIRSSELALQRSGSAQIRRIASMLIEAHKGTSAQLSFAGRRLNLLPSATLQAAHQAMFDELLSAGNFDAAYLRLERAVHRQGISLDRAYAANGRSPTLRPVAAERLAITLRHLSLLDK